MIKFILLIALVGMSHSIQTALAVEEVLNECQGEGCDCFRAYNEAKDQQKPTDFPIQTLRSFTLYEKTNKKSKVLGSYKPNILARPLGYKSLVVEKGLSVVKKVINKAIPLRRGDKLHTLIKEGEGFTRAKKLEKSPKAEKWVSFSWEDLEIEVKSETLIEEWLEVQVGKIRGFTQEVPFEGCLE